MDHLTFLPFHNRHIKFFYEGEHRDGVVVDSIPHENKEFSNQYAFISHEKMIPWKAAEKIQDITTMKGLEVKIDISKIANPILLAY